MLYQLSYTPKITFDQHQVRREAQTAGAHGSKPKPRGVPG